MEPCLYTLPVTTPGGQAQDSKLHRPHYINQPINERLEPSASLPAS